MHPGEKCSSPSAAPRASVVLHTNGIHPVTLLYCECDSVHLAGSPKSQLLRAELYPASLIDPATFCTVRMLEHFHVLTLQSKMAAYDWYETLARLSDNTGLGQQHVSIGDLDNLWGADCYD